MRARVSRWTTAALAALLALGALAPAGGQVPAEPDGPRIGTSFPEDFPVIVDHSLGVPVIGFGAKGPVTRVPVVLLHGNNDTPYPTDCNGAYGKIQALAQHFADHGYAPSELWALGYQGEQCDLVTSPPNRSGPAHSTVENVPDLRAFVHAVLAYTGAGQVDIVGHSLGATLPREWMRQDGAHHLVRRLVSIDGPHHGIINCSPNPRNIWQTPASGGFTPDSAICVEYGADDTPFLRALNAGDETPGPTEYFAIRNADASFVFMDRQDGRVPPVPAEDREGRPHDFSMSAALAGAQRSLDVTGAGAYDDALAAAHTGVVNSPEVWDAALAFLTEGTEPPAQEVVDDGAPGGPASTGGPELPASGPAFPLALALAVLALGLALLPPPALRRR
ncbi:MAG TPA: alpha/beta fold hydrolase [Egibacteraceae bacterium]|nr:alpha/beta fold hydrolase [Egibacteraceae bacterium]